MTEKLKGKKIVIGITGSISAYKAPNFVRELIKAGAEVRVVMTPSACEFITPLTLECVSQNPVAVDMFPEKSLNESTWHIEMAHWCDAMMIAPCSASTIGKIANGICDTALVTVAIALPEGTPLIIAPAMDYSMWLSKATQNNIKILENYGYVIIPPEEGELASGLTGPGRLPENDILINYLIDTLYSKENLSYRFLDGKKVLITAGPTYEKIDDVRFIANYSSGKMGFSLAKEAQKAGADVVLVSGPVMLQTPDGVRRIDVESADEMYDVVCEEFQNTDIALLAAAVADFTPISPFSGKIKKIQVGDRLTLELQSTNDILATLGTLKTEKQKLVGFALESSNDIENGFMKLKQKNCDMIIVNSAVKPRSGFRGDDNTITILTSNGLSESFPAMSKDKCSQIILKKVTEI
ncbi:MAG: bifunctional phosphopantothenoylcysteine decarboxylase/phosphopantothenate--cysteine ligase CoaBC [FCB group bacterium]|jgi:phosphopantothenoylcysteine decarboxylase/phosphopantothenate--cysteine ligase